MRQIWATSIYRWILGFCAAVALMRAFPEANVAIGLTFLFARQVALATDLLAQARQMALTEQVEMSDRKTRHAILLAAQKRRLDEDLNDWSFWPEVNRRVSDELGDEREDRPKTKWWVHAGIVAGRISLTFISDMVGLGIALAFSS